MNMKINELIKTTWTFVNMAWEKENKKTDLRQQDRTYQNEINF